MQSSTAFISTMRSVRRYSLGLRRISPSRIFGSSPIGTQRGGAGVVAISTGGDAIFDKVYLRDNYSESYTTLYLTSGGRVSISNSEIVNNSIGMSWGSSGVLSEYGGAVKIRGTKLY